jgi:hypothetical protein
MNGPDEGKRFDITVDVSEAVVGRGNDCDFQINDANISRRHAIIRRDWNEITIEDAGSKNGVVINDRKIARPTALRDADEVLLGAVRLTFIDPSAKFIGRLDDIPAFADAATGMDEPEPEPDDNDEPAYNEGAGPGPDVDTRTTDRGPDALLADAVDENQQVEPGAFDDDPEPVTPKGLGAVEIALIGGAAVAVLGLAVGVAVLVLGS